MLSKLPQCQSFQPFFALCFLSHSFPIFSFCSTASSSFLAGGFVGTNSFNNTIWAWNITTNVSFSQVGTFMIVTVVATAGLQSLLNKQCQIDRSVFSPAYTVDTASRVFYYPYPSGGGNVDIKAW